MTCSDREVVVVVRRWGSEQGIGFAPSSAIIIATSITSITSIVIVVVISTTFAVTFTFSSSTSISLPPSLPPLVVRPPLNSRVALANGINHSGDGNHHCDAITINSVL